MQPDDSVLIFDLKLCWRVAFMVTLSETRSNNRWPSVPPGATPIAGTPARPLQAAAITCCIAFGQRAGHKTLTLSGAMPREPRARQPLCADIELHAAARVQVRNRKRLEQLCREITRPALSDERVQLNAARQVELRITPAGSTSSDRSNSSSSRRLAPCA